MPRPGGRLACVGRLRAASLKVKVTAGFMLLVLASAAVSTWLGHRIVTSAMLEVTERRVDTGLAAARLLLDADVDRVRRSVALAAMARRISNAIHSGRESELPELLGELRAEHGLDFLAYVEGASGRVWRPAHPSGGAARGPAPAFVDATRSGEPYGGAEVMEAVALEAEREGLGARAQMPIRSGPHEQATAERALEKGLVLAAAAPVRVDGELVGIMYGGELLNRSVALVDRIRATAFGGETYGGREIGTASLFVDDVRIATNVLVGPDERAIGTRASVQVVDTVLHGGREWLGRAFVVHEWCVTAYQPIRDRTERIIGMLYVGMSEAPYLSVRTEMMVSFLVVVVGGLFLVLGLAYLIARRMVHPLETFVDAAGRVAAGDLDHCVPVGARDEIGRLAASFNQMVASLKSTTRALEESARTLEQRVEERTRELATVQAQMVQSEKLASLGRMAAGVAHEINNPLGGILTFAMLAQEDSAPEAPLRRHIDIIVKQTLRCRDIVKGLLEFARESDANATPTEVNQALRRTMALLDQQPAFHDVTVDWQLGVALPEALVDPNQLQQVVVNLVLNAVDAMGQKGRLTLGTSRHPAEALVGIHITDGGPGIPDEVRPLIFEPFFTTKEVGKGTGLGLAIVHGIVARASGRIDVESSPAGTTFTVWLPVGVAAREGPMPRSAASAADDRWQADPT